MVKSVTGTKKNIFLLLFDQTDLLKEHGKQKTKNLYKIT